MYKFKVGDWITVINKSKPSMNKSAWPCIGHAYQIIKTYNSFGRPYYELDIKDIPKYNADYDWRWPEKWLKSSLKKKLEMLDNE